MRKLVEVGPGPDLNEDLCSALLKLNLGLNDQRIIGSIALQDQVRKARHGVLTNVSNSYVDLLQPLRGDKVIEYNTSRLYLHNSDDWTGNGTLMINGLSLANLGSDAVLKAFTVDGLGGTIDWKTPRFHASLAYYLENIYIQVPFARLEKINQRIGINNINMPCVLSPQMETLKSWYSEYYLKAIEESPTKRPITENYFRQLRAQGFPTGEEADLGNVFFTNITYKKLQAKELMIMKAAQIA